MFLEPMKGYLLGNTNERHGAPSSSHNNIESQGGNTVSSVGACPFDEGYDTLSFF